MSASLQNKLQQFEVAPPPSVWDKISHQLVNEFVAGDINVSSKLENASMTAPVGMWDKINAELNNPAEEEVLSIPESVITEKNKTIPLYRRIAVAAIIIGLLFTAGIYFLNSNETGKELVSTLPKTKAPTVVVDNTPPTLATITPPSVVGRRIESKAPRKRNNTAFATQAESEEYTSVPEEAHLYDLQTVSALQPVSVSGPPLRDTKGNIILDASLISNPEDEYIVVTGPNGKQTKISSKFLSCLGYINASLSSNNMDPRELRCKTQFEEWRKKILAQPGFIPTANNFFDIFELKDMLQEL